MKTLFYSFLIIVAIGSFSGCFVGSSARSLYKAPGFSYSGTFKIIAVNTDDILLGRLENQLLKNGFNLISDNYLRGALPMGSTTVRTGDTTYQVPNHEMMAVRFSDEKPADYIIRYQYSGSDENRIYFLNINVTNSKTGKTEVSFAYPEKAGSIPVSIPIDDAIYLFVTDLRR